MIRTVTAVAALCALSSFAEARPRVQTPSPECNITMPCFFGDETPAPAKRRHARAARDAFASVEPSAAFGAAPSRRAAREETASQTYSAGLVGPLAAKLASIESACPGTHAISGVRHTRIAGTHRMSLHAQGKAVDVRGPYGCIYAQLKGWSGGYSTDAGRMQHIHISYDESGGREMGLRFAHHGGRRHSWHEAYARAQ